jgi:hypothetical protein
MAVYDDVLISNMALGHLGIGQAVTDLLATDDVSVTCNRWYTIARDSVLTSFAWPVASRKLTLGLVETDPDSADGDWGFSYRYPNTCLVARRIVGGGLPVSVTIPFALGQDDTGRLVFTNEEDAVLECTAFYEDPGEFPDKFAEAVSWKLASLIAMPLTQDLAKADWCKNNYREWRLEAEGVANQERQLHKPPVSTLATARN